MERLQRIRIVEEGPEPTNRSDWRVARKERQEEEEVVEEEEEAEEEICRSEQLSVRAV